jgi:hypothetical protein
MTMICGSCNQPGIRWMGPMSQLTHTECPHCGGTNCQVVDQPEDPEEEEEVLCACGSEYGPPNADDGKFYCNRGHGGAYHCAP